MDAHPQVTLAPIPESIPLPNFTLIQSNQNTMHMQAPVIFAKDAVDLAKPFTDDSGVDVNVILFTPSTGLSVRIFYISNCDSYTSECSQDSYHRHSVTHFKERHAKCEARLAFGYALKHWPGNCFS